MPKVLRIINRFNLGGPTYNVAILTRFLSPEYETMLVGAQKEEGEESSEFILKDMGVNYTILPSMGREINPLNDVKTIKELIRIIKNFKPDIVHTHASKAGAVGRIAARLCGVKVIVHTFHGHVFHSYFGPLKTAVYRKIEQFLAGISDAVIAVSRKQKLELTETHRICRPEKVHVIPLGFILDRYLKINLDQKTLAKQNFNIPSYKFIFGSIGRLAPIKNHTLLIKAFHKAFTDSDDKPALVIVGDGPLLSELRNLSHDLGLTTSYKGENESADIIFTGWLKYVEHILPAFDVMVMSSLNEGTPVSLIEAQASGIPVISTDVGGVRDIVLEGKSGFIVPSNDVNSLAQEMRRIVEQPELITSMRNTGREFVQKHFSADILANNMRDLYQKLLQLKS